MRLRLLFLLIITVGLFASCKNDDDKPVQRISGVWNLNNVLGGLQGMYIGYAQGDVVWNFNTENRTISIENNVITDGPESIYAGPETGSYNYTTTYDGIETLFINGDKMGVLIFESEILKIEEGAAVDGFVTEFRR